MRRTIRKTVTGSTQYDGAGVRLVRVISRPDVEDFDPFLMLDAFDSTDSADYVKGFPWHPHRGIETVTYLIEGTIEHGDSLGNKGSIDNGCCQWMTAGGGILHQEMPKESPRMLGVQLWLNLPAKDKMTAPKYHDIRAEQVPAVETEAGTTRVIAGSYQGTAGPGQGEFVPMTMLDVALNPGCEWNLTVPAADTVFVYVVRGEGSFAEQDGEIQEKHAVLFREGEELSVTAGAQGVRFLLFSGPPLKETIAWGGPIVMNTRQELQQAFLELEQGTFVKD